MTLEEAAAFAHCSVSTLRRRIREGALPATRIGPTDRSPVRVDAAELESWLAQNPAAIAASPVPPARREVSLQPPGASPAPADDASPRQAQP
jgi:excisionase family DNA binding protein